jgi:hypothetical protein
MTNKTFLKHWIPLLLTAACTLFLTGPAHSAPKKRFTVMCYMNGDNDLAEEVLHAVDRMETVGSSDQVNVFALVDGGAKATASYGDDWQGTKLLHISKDDVLGSLGSTVLKDLGEQNLADPRTLHDFIAACLRYPADRYVFLLFSHGRGIIDTRSLSLPGRQKTLSISPDETDRAIMTHQQFRDAIQGAMGTNRFDLMVLFSCLTNMVEIGYSLRTTTHYLVASQDEIRIVNHPPGAFQIRGIKFEQLLARLRDDPGVSTEELGHTVVDAFIDQYTQDIPLPGDDRRMSRKRFAGGLSLIDCNHYDAVASCLDKLARHLQLKMTDSSDSRPVLESFRRALGESQRYGSFLNLEYYDLRNFLQNLNRGCSDPVTKRYCEEAMEEISSRLVVYERHTEDCRSNGVSIYLSHFLVPENVYQSHRQMYKACLFSQDTAWDEMIDLYRRRMQEEDSKR